MTILESFLHENLFSSRASGSGELDDGKFAKVFPAKIYFQAFFRERNPLHGITIRDT